MARAADITAGRCGAPCAGRWCILRAGHKLGQGWAHRATPRTRVEAATARAFAEMAGAREPPPHHPQALCKHEDPDLFFPDKPGSADEQRAREICARCPIREECLQWALIHRVRHGIWGGAGEAERAAMLKGQPGRRGGSAGNGRRGRITNPGERLHGTTARYASGPDEHDVPGQGCRCRECMDAHNAARNRRARLQATGRWEPFVDAGPVREHVKDLQAFGIGRRRLAELSGVSPGSLQALLFPKQGKPPSRQVRPETRDRILAVKPVLENLDDTVLVDPAEYRGQLRALIAAGWSPRWLAGRIGMEKGAFYRVIGSQRWMAASTAKAVKKAYRELRDQQPPRGTPAERKAVQAALSLAGQRGWTPVITAGKTAAAGPEPGRGRPRKQPAEAA